MEPGVLRELIDEANGTPRSPRCGKTTDTLGFYLEGQSCGMFDTAAECQRKANQLRDVSLLVRLTVQYMEIG